MQRRNLRLRPLTRCALLAIPAIIVTSGLPLAPTPAPPPRIETAAVRLAGQGAASDRALVRLAPDAGVIDPAQPARSGWAARVALPNHGQMVGLTWTGAGEVQLELRSHDARAWSDWVQLDSGADEAPDAPEGRGVKGIGPIWVGEGTDLIDLRVRAGSLAQLTMHSLESVEPRSARAGISAASAAASPPSLIPRADWGARPWSYSTSGCENGPRYATPRLAIVHHTVNTNSYSAEQADDLVRGIQAFHIDAEGYCDIAYNFVIDRFGRRFEARAGGADRGVVGGHARGFNTGTIGVALLGDFSKTGAPAVMGASLDDLLTWKFFIHGIDSRAIVGFVSGCSTEGGYRCKYPGGTMAVLPTVIVHGDVTYTGCPGQAASFAPTLRRDVSPQVLRSGPFHPIAGWQPTPDRPALLTLDRWGGIHPAGSASSVSAAFGWPGFAIARGIAGTPEGGYVLDGYGGLAEFGTAAPRQSPVYWRGWDIARSIAMVNDRAGYVLDGWGGVHAFGGALPATGGPYWPGWDIARDVATLPAGTGGYVLDGWGGVHAFGAAPKVSGGPYWQGWDIARAVALRPDGPGGYVLDGFGGLHPFGGAPPMTVSRYAQGQDVFRDVVVVPGGGAYVLDWNGFVWPAGNAAPVTTSLTWTDFDLAAGLLVGP